jgi:hypothetical protein
MTVSPSMPTGISDPLASTTISWAVSIVRPCPRGRRRSSSACRALFTVTATTPSVRGSSRARRLSGAQRTPPGPQSGWRSLPRRRATSALPGGRGTSTHLPPPGNAPTAPTATMATLPRLAKPITTAASRSTKADRASLRRCGPLAARRIAAGGGSCARSVLMIVSLAGTAGRNPRVFASRPAGRRARDHHLPRPPPATAASGAGPADRCQPLQPLSRREQMPSGPPGVAGWPDERAQEPQSKEKGVRIAAGPVNPGFAPGMAGTFVPDAQIPGGASVRAGIG